MECPRGTWPENSLRISASLGKGIGNVVDYGNTGCGEFRKFLEFANLAILIPCMKIDFFVPK